MKNIKVDARGFACPEPVLMTKKALVSNPDCLEVLVDNQTSVQNITRFVNTVGKTATVTPEAEDFLLTIK
ncbi:MAG: sulfurtransferase TusA family protein [Lachnospiraceae bacterium]